MSRVALRAAAGLMAALVVSSAAAEPIYRCGDSYAQVACTHARSIDVGQPTTVAQQHEARAVAMRERQLALDMVRDRQERERETRPALAASLGPLRPATLASPAPKKHLRAKKQARVINEERDFIAAVPRVRK